MSSGHVFIVRSDLTSLACDDWLLPGDAHGPGRSWQNVHHGRPPSGAEWRGPHASVLRWPAPAGAPQPWLVKIGTRRKNTPSWHIERVRDFLSIIEAEYRSRPPARRRQRHLAAVPLVGTGHGGAARISGEIVGAMLDTLYEFVARTGIDVALVLHTDEAHHAAQAARKARGAAAWGQLKASTRQQADQLADEALAGNLALFFGAGISAAAGLPSWDNLLAGLAEAGGLDPQQLGALAALPPLDRAHFIERKLGSQQDLFDEIRRRLVSHHFSLSHALLASLPSLEAVTTNYDDLFEQACEAVGRPVTVIPDERLRRGQRWLLKLHGSVNGDPRDLVLTRQSYLRYGNDRAALAGTVAGLLLTRHMLFVGFSMSDDNFLRIADEVRRATRSAVSADGDGPPLGTSLAVGSSALHRELWGDELRWVDLGPLPRGARQLEIALDRALASATTPTSHLFDPCFEAMLSTDERAFREQLTHMHEALPPALHHTAVGRAFDDFLVRLGWARHGS